MLGAPRPLRQTREVQYWIAPNATGAWSPPPMHDIDFNLIAPLDALLTERSVTGAARKLGLSVSAMSRTLARLRSATGDPLLVPAGRSLVPTPYAESLADRVHALAGDARAILGQATHAFDPAAQQRSYVIRANDGFIDLMGARIINAVAAVAPGVRLQFVPKPDKDARPHREGHIDLEIGVLGTDAPELRTRLLFSDRFVGICRTAHPALENGGMTIERYAHCRHVVVARKMNWSGPVDVALDELGLHRVVAMVVPGHATAMRVVRDTDLVGLVPASCVGIDAAGLHVFEPPVRTPGIKVSLIWHPRVHGDRAHQWLRETIFTACAPPRPAT